MRKNNINLHLYEITAPRKFGEGWAQNHIQEMVPGLKKPSNRHERNYSGEYDFWYDGIKIEVKVSRADVKNSNEPLVKKALRSNDKYKFDMNFQQIKPKCCDVFLFIGVWRDLIRYWILSSKEINENYYFNKRQHRGNVGEGQLWIKDSNIHDFDIYLVETRDIPSKIIYKGKNNRL